jgi:Cof subfamily protein (haloacid dehalogenase superfamily)
MPLSPNTVDTWISRARRDLSGVLLVFDLDGTLVDDALHMKPRDLEAIRELRQRGARSTVATGRTFDSAEPFVKQLGIDIPVILCNGAAVFDPVREILLYERAIPKELTRAALSLAERHGLEPVVYTNAIRGDPSAAGLTPQLGGFLLLEGLHRVQLGVWDDLMELDAVKIQLIGEHKAVRSAQRAARSEAPNLPLVMSQNDYLEVLPPGASKGLTLRELCRIVGIPLRQTLAFGDGRNDAEMLVEAGLGVAMAGAPEELRRVADLTISDVSVLLQRLIS